MQKTATPTILALLLVPVPACDGGEGHQETCERADPAELRTFPLCDEGSGAFGLWDLDSQGLPAFRYTADQESDARAQWELTTGEVRSDHFFQVGNDRLIAIVSNDGFVQLFNRDRAPTGERASQSRPSEHWGLERRYRLRVRRRRESPGDRRVRARYADGGVGVSVRWTLSVSCIL